MPKRFAVVGFGCAGYHALKTLREDDDSAEIHVFSDTEEPPANPMLTTYYAGGHLSYDGMFPFGSLEDISRRFTPVYHTGVSVERLSPETRTLHFDGGQESFDAILLATGADPAIPPLGVSVGKRVLSMRTVNDAKLLRERLESNAVRSVTVVGASMVGIKIIELCREAGISCTLAGRSPQVFPRAAFPDVAEEIHRRLERQGVTLHFGSALTGAAERDDSVELSFANGDCIVSDLLVLCSGTHARTRLAAEAGLLVAQGIVVDDSMHTSASGIYAAGDCCQGRNVMTGANQIIGLWANAAFQGETAGHCMAGEPVRFSGNIPHNITHFMGMDFISFGDVSATGQIHTIGSPGDRRYVKAIVDDGQLRCVNLLDSYHISGVVKNYMMNRFTGNHAPLPAALRGMLASEGFTDAFLSLFEAEGGAEI